MDLRFSDTFLGEKKKKAYAKTYSANILESIIRIYVQRNNNEHDFYLNVGLKYN